MVHAKTVGFSISLLSIWCNANQSLCFPTSSLYPSAHIFVLTILQKCLLVF